MSDSNLSAGDLAVNKIKNISSMDNKQQLLSNARSEVHDRNKKWSECMTLKQREKQGSEGENYVEI